MDKNVLARFHYVKETINEILSVNMNNISESKIEKIISYRDECEACVNVGDFVKADVCLNKLEKLIYNHNGKMILNLCNRGRYNFLTTESSF